MSEMTVKPRQLVDWGAAVWAGLTAGIVYFVVDLILNAIYVGAPWLTIRLWASIILGERVLPPPADFHLPSLLAALAIHLPLSILFACLVAYVIHRWGIIIGIIGGGLMGLALFFVNTYTFSLVFNFPWFYLLSSWITVVGHIIYGATAGGVYELLEVEEYV